MVDLVRLALAPGLPPGMDLPVVLFYDELEHLNSTVWLGFERILYIQDRSAGAGQLGGGGGQGGCRVLAACMGDKGGEKKARHAAMLGKPGLLGESSSGQCHIASLPVDTQ